VSKKLGTNLFAINSVGLLFLALLWLKSPVGRLTLLERQDFRRFDERKRQQVNGELAIIARQNQRLALRQRAVSLLLREPAYSHFLELPPQAFDGPARRRVRQLATQENPHPAHLLYAGLLYDRSVIPRLKQANNWEAKLALARMNDVKAIDFCLSRLSYKPKTDLLENQKAIRELDYIRQMGSIGALTQYLNSDEVTYICTSGETSMASEPTIMDGRLTAMAAALRLSQSLEGFPTKDRMNFNLETARTWVRAQTQLKILRTP